jgi:hypothetical protein
MPIKNRITAKPVAVWVSPVRPVGMALHKRTSPIKILGPNLSQKGPRRKRMTIVPDTAVIDDVHICCLVRSNDV